jgi:hypothetical protein
MSRVCKDKRERMQVPTYVTRIYLSIYPSIYPSIHLSIYLYPYFCYTIYILFYNNNNKNNKHQQRITFLVP